MKKKNLVVLLILPFIISLLGVITVNATVKTIEKDILAIEWSYGDMEGFKIDGDKTYRLQAKAVTDKSAPLAAGNDLVWTVQNKDVTQDDCAEIYSQAGVYYLKPLAEGEVNVTCSNAKGNCSRRMTAVIYKDGAILVKTGAGASQNNIDDTLYIGEYDFTNGQKTKAVVQLGLSCAPTDLKDKLSVKEQSSNVNFDMASQKLSVLADGDAQIVFSTYLNELEITYTYAFKIVKDGVNVYTYDDLLNCTNRSAEGEIVVLRKSFEALSNAYSVKNDELVFANGLPVKKSANVENFGYYTDYLGEKKFDFSKDVYRFKTTYNTNFIDQWNDFAKTNASTYKTITKELVAGLRVQKDFYGNGYTINLHNLTFPYDEHEVGDVTVPSIVSENLFKGPLPFYTLGDPNNMPLVSAFGQDNVGMFVDADNVTVNDVVLKNCDFGSSLSFLEYTGTVLEVGGDNVTIANSRISNGKNVIRAFSAENTAIRNCSLSYAQNFLLTLGSNEITPIDDKTAREFYDSTGASFQTSVKDYFEANGVADEILAEYLISQNDANAMQKKLSVMQKALNATNEPLTVVNVEVNDTMFYRSGIASIALDTAFNGPFLYAKNPTMISDVFQQISDKTSEGRKLVPFMAENVSGVSRPVRLTISGNTKFYDYKTVDEMDLSGLIDENMTKAVAMIMENFEALNREITIDDVFPLKSMLFKQASSRGQTYVANGKTYLNVAVAYYGGGVNLSEVVYEEFDNQEEYDDVTSLRWINEYLKYMGEVSEDDMASLKNLAQKMVTVVTGFEDFKFVCMKGNGYLYGEAPSESELRENIRG